jgi:recombinational DNA repair protein (RecF pathway)
MRESFVEFGIIIKTAKINDADLRLTIFTADGVKYATAKSVLKAHSKFASSVGLFTVAEFTISGSTVTGISVLISPFAISRDINRYFLANSIADSLLSLEFVERTPDILVLGISALTELAEMKKSCYRIFIEYFSAVFTLLGYSLDIDYNKNAELKLPNAKAIMQKIIRAFLINTDYKIKFIEDFL